MRTFSILTSLAVIIALSSFTPLNTNELSWTNWNDGYAMAKKKNKIAVVDVYTDWCGWCKVMDRETFTKPGVIDLMNKEFVAIKFNPEKEGSYTYDGKQYSGQQLAALISNNQLSGYPTTVFYFPQTKEFKIEVGFKNAEQFTDILNNMVKYKSSASSKKKG